MSSSNDLPDWAELLAKTLMQSLKERDPYTYGHCRRVASNSVKLAEAAGLTAREQKIVEYSSLFHDLGKLGIPDRVLFKPGRLTPEEVQIMKEHPIRSVDVLTPLANVPFFRATFPGIRAHHERYDGRGYPDKLAGDNIPLSARIILIADTFDAMTTSRPYRKGMDAEHAYKELSLFAGRQFDKQLVKIFLQAHPYWDEYDEEITESFVAKQFKRAA